MNRILAYTFAALIIFVLMVSACHPAPAYVTQGYETDAGYMQPDHSAFYYWLAYHSTFGYYRPSVNYHVYVPPLGYPSTYRPWYGRTVAPRYYTPSTATPARTGGGFSGSPRSYNTPSTPARTGGGFSAPRSYSSPSTPARSSGGFSSAPRSSGGFGGGSSSRSSGGFSSGRRR